MRERYNWTRVNPFIAWPTVGKRTRKSPTVREPSKWSDDHSAWRKDVITLAADAMMTIPGAKPEHRDVAQRLAMRKFKNLETAVQFYTTRSIRSPWLYTYQAAALIVLPIPLALQYARQELGERFWDMAAFEVEESKTGSLSWNCDFDRADYMGSGGLVDLASDVGFRW